MNSKRKPGISSEHLFGPVHIDEPTTREIVEATEARSDADEAQASNVRAYLDENPVVAKALKAGLDEMRRLDARAPADSDAVRGSSAAEVREAVLAIAVPPLRMAAATDDDLSPFPEDHQTLLDDERGICVSYFFRAGQACVGVFSADPQRAFVAACELDDVGLAVDGDAAEVVISLGHPAQLVGRQLVLKLQVGEEPLTMRYTLIGEKTGT